MVIVYSSCTDKLDITQFDDAYDDDSSIGDTVYIQLNPIWEGFNNPQDMIIGKETFIYVADTDNDRIVMMNVAGDVLGEIGVLQPVALEQDYQLNLIVCAEFDTTISGSVRTYGAIYKIDLFNAGHQIADAKITRLLPRTSDLNKTNRRYTGVTVFEDNSFFVARTGPDNSSQVDPDNVILSFKKKTLSDGTKRDTLVGIVPSFQSTGTGLLSAYNISSLTSFDDGTYDFIVTLTGNTSFKTQWMSYVQSQDYTGYQNELEAFTCELMTVDKFTEPEDAAVDESGNIYVADAAKDSIFTFSSFGDELTSFGGSDMFNSPHAVAYDDEILYVLDSQNNRIVRFILSTDTE